MDGNYFMGIILPFAGSTVPSGWLPCDGRSLKVSDYKGLYAIIQNQFGGVLDVSFNLPNLQGSVPVGVGQGDGLSQITLGQVGGTGQVDLNVSEIPSHKHSFVVSGSTASTNSPSNNFLANANDPSTSPASSVNSYSNATPDGMMNNEMITQTGSGMGHNNIMPSLTIQYIICCVGSFPNPS